MRLITVPVIAFSTSLGVFAAPCPPPPVTTTAAAACIARQELMGRKLGYEVKISVMASAPGQELWLVNYEPAASGWRGGSGRLGVVKSSGDVKTIASYR